MTRHPKQVLSGPVQGSQVASQQISFGKADSDVQNQTSHPSSLPEEGSLQASKPASHADLPEVYYSTVPHNTQEVRTWKPRRRRTQTHTHTHARTEIIKSLKSFQKTGRALQAKAKPKGLAEILSIGSPSKPASLHQCILSFDSVPASFLEGRA